MLDPLMLVITKDLSTFSVLSISNILPLARLETLIVSPTLRPTVDSLEDVVNVIVLLLEFTVAAEIVIAFVPTGWYAALDRSNCSFTGSLRLLWYPLLSNVTVIVLGLSTETILPKAL